MQLGSFNIPAERVQQIPPWHPGAVGVFGSLPIVTDPRLPNGSMYVADFGGTGRLVLLKHRPWTRRERRRMFWRRVFRLGRA